MPVAQINILDGRTDEQKKMLIHEITDAIVRSLGAPVDSVRVILNEMPKQHFDTGGQSAKKQGRLSPGNYGEVFFREET